MRVRAVFAWMLMAGLCRPADPGLHVHVDDDHDRDHHAALIHSHAGLHHRGSSPAPTLAEHESSATYVATTAAVPSQAPPSIHLVALTLDLPVVPPDETSHATWTDDLVPSVHGPPGSPFGLRAPPAFRV